MAASHAAPTTTNHFSNNPDIIRGAIEARSSEAVRPAYVYTFLHWGFAAWGTYALVGLAIVGSIVLMNATADITAPERAYYGTDTRAFGILAGAVLAFWWRPERVNAAPPASGVRGSRGRAPLAHEHVSKGMATVRRLQQHGAQALAERGPRQRQRADISRLCACHVERAGL